MFIIIYFRSNIYFVMSKLSQYINNSNIYYKVVIKYLLKYLRFIKKFQIYYRIQSKSKQIIRYFDSNFVINKDNKRLVFSFVFKFINRFISKIGYK